MDGTLNKHELKKLESQAAAYAISKVLALPENGSTGTPSFLSNGAVKTYETAYWEKLNELMEEAKKQGET
jgi:hypothetical protein